MRFDEKRLYILPNYYVNYSIVSIRVEAVALPD
jgi:hypothetical protein